MNKTFLMITIFISSTLSQTNPADAASQLMDRGFFESMLGKEFLPFFDAAQPALNNMLQSGSAPPSPVAAPVPAPQQFDLSALFGQAPVAPVAPIAPVASVGGGFNPYLPSTPHSHTIPVDVSASAARPGPSTVSVQPTNETSSHSHSGGMSNPFLASPAPVQQSAPTEVVLVHDKEAMPVFHPVEGKTHYVPNYPPVEGQHWYQYKRKFP